MRHHLGCPCKPTLPNVSRSRKPKAQQLTKTLILGTDVCHNAVASRHIESQIFLVSIGGSPRVSAIFGRVTTKYSNFVVAMHRRSTMLGPLTAYTVVQDGVRNVQGCAAAEPLAALAGKVRLGVVGKFPINPKGYSGRVEQLLAG